MRLKISGIVSAGQQAGITVASDGVTDSFLPEKYIDFNIQLFRNFINYPNQAQQNLQDFLPKLSERGSNDDVSIAGVFNITKGKKIIERSISHGSNGSFM